MTARKRGDELWRKLRVGDCVRLVEYPREFLAPGYGIHRDTVRLYRRLLARRRPLRVYKVDAWGCPWIRCRFQLRDGRWEHHHLMINNSGLERVRSRKK